MAIQMRRGQYADLDKSKLVAGEIVVALDNDKDYVGVAKSADNVLQMATLDANGEVPLEQLGIHFEGNTLVI